jgi:hypothetical protein
MQTVVSIKTLLGLRYRCLIEPKRFKIHKGYKEMALFSGFRIATVFPSSTTYFGVSLAR